MKASKQKQFICDTYLKNKERIYGDALLLTGNHYDAEDISIDVLIKAIEKYSFGRNEKILKSWFFKTKCSLSIDLLRRKNVLNEKTAKLENAEKTKVNIDIPEEMLEKKEYASWFWECFYLLSEGNQKILQLYAYEQLSYIQIAKMYGITLSAVKSRIFYARKLLKESLSKNRLYEKSDKNGHR